MFFMKYGRKKAFQNLQIPTAHRLLWRLEHFWSVKDGEPTEFYLAVSRIIGVIALITDIIIIITLVF